MDRKAMKKMFLSNKMAVVCTVLILIIVIYFWQLEIN